MIVKTHVAHSLQEKSLGLIGHKKPIPFLFQTRFGIHTFGLRFSIDVVVLDKSNRVVKLQQNLVPNRIFVWNPKYDKVLELPEGAIKKLHLTQGSCVNMV